MEAEIIKLLESGFIVECESDFSSPLVVVRKREGSIRLCCKYRALNERLVDYHYITANPAEILSSAAGATVVSTIDLKQAFWQVEMEDDSVKYTSNIYQIYIQMLCRKFRMEAYAVWTKNKSKNPPTID